MRSFRWISSLLLLFLFACSPYRHLQKGEETTFEESGLTRPFGQSTKGQVYQAGIDVYDNYFTGLFVIKKLGPRNYRVVFTTEMGMKLMDFSFDQGTFKVEYCFDKLDRKPVIKRLRKDFRLLLMSSIASGQVGKAYQENDQKIFNFDGEEDGDYWYYLENGKLTKGENANWREKKMVMTLEGKNNEPPEKIKFEHEDIELALELESVKR